MKLSSRCRNGVIAAVCVAFSLPLLGSPALADGTETLGVPSTAIGAGTGLVAAGTGLLDQPGQIDINVPGTVVQVLLYWGGFNKSDTTDGSSIVVSDGMVAVNVDGTLIGGPTFFFSGAYSTGFRADITGLGYISSGANTVILSGLDFVQTNLGAGLLVIYDDGSATNDIEIRDGVDNAFVNFPDPRRDTIPQTYNFDSADFDRMARVSMFFASIAGSASGGTLRPSSIEISVGTDVTTLSNELDSLDGDEWDTLVADVEVPAGATSLTVQAFSRDDLGTGEREASFFWVAASMAIMRGTQPPMSCEDGKPIELVFEYTGGDCTSTQDQEGKFTCSGTPPAGDVQLVVEGGISDPAGESIGVGTMVSVKPSGDKFASQTDFEIRQGGQVVQALSMHLSCSKPLNVGDRFGSLTLRVLVPGAGGGGMGGMGGMGMGMGMGM